MYLDFLDVVCHPEVIVRFFLASAAGVVDDGKQSDTFGLDVR